MPQKETTTTTTIWRKTVLYLEEIIVKKKLCKADGFLPEDKEMRQRVLELAVSAYAKATEKEFKLRLYRMDSRTQNEPPENEAPEKMVTNL